MVGRKVQGRSGASGRITAIMRWSDDEGELFRSQKSKGSGLTPEGLGDEVKFLLLLSSERLVTVICLPPPALEQVALEFLPPSRPERR